MQSGVISTKFKFDEWLKIQNDTFILAEAAINPFIRELALEQYGCEETALYWRDLGETHASISPYLFRFRNWKQFAKSIAFQPNWGILVCAKHDIATFNNVQQILLAHLKEWSFIETPDKERMLLRISDFQVLKNLCAASNAAELNGIFGPILEFAYWQEGQEHVEVLSLAESLENVEPVPHRSPQVLSERQYAALQAFATLNQNKQYAEHLKAHHPEVSGWQDSKLAEFLTKNIQKAQSYFFENKRDTVRYLSLAVVFGENFDSQPWAKDMLTTQSVEGVEQRMDRLYQAAFEQIENQT